VQGGGAGIGLGGAQLAARLAALGAGFDGMGQELVLLEKFVRQNVAACAQLAQVGWLAGVHAYLPACLPACLAAWQVAATCWRASLLACLLWACTAPHVFSISWAYPYRDLTYPPTTCTSQMHDQQQQWSAGGELPLSAVEGPYLAAAHAALLGELRFEPLVLGLSDAYELCRCDGRCSGPLCW